MSSNLESQLHSQAQAINHILSNESHCYLLTIASNWPEADRQGWIWDGDLEEIDLHDQHGNTHPTLFALSSFSHWDHWQDPTNTSQDHITISPDPDTFEIHRFYQLQLLWKISLQFPHATIETFLNPTSGSLNPETRETIYQEAFDQLAHLHLILQQITQK